MTIKCLKTCLKDREVCSNDIVREKYLVFNVLKCKTKVVTIWHNPVKKIKLASTKKCVSHSVIFYKLGIFTKSFMHRVNCKRAKSVSVLW